MHYKRRHSPRQPSIETLNTQVDAWNKAHPEGTAVKVRKDDGAILTTRTRSNAWVMGGHSAVICVVGISGGYDLDRVTPA